MGSHCVCRMASDTRYPTSDPHWCNYRNRLQHLAKTAFKKQMEIKLPKLKDAEDTEELLNDFTTFWLLICRLVLVVKTMMYRNLFGQINDSIWYCWWQIRLWNSRICIAHKNTGHRQRILIRKVAAGPYCTRLWIRQCLRRRPSTGFPFHTETGSVSSLWCAVMIWLVRTIWFYFLSFSALQSIHNVLITNL